jgi:anaerobic magnesium-protoporphyrin IX monomethyl ester cyclase
VKVVLACRGAVGREKVMFDEFPQLDALAGGEIDAYARDFAAHPDLRGIPGLATPDNPSTGSIRVVEDLDEFPIPAIELLPPIWSGGTKGFALPYYGVPSGYMLETARGCPYTCNYCMVGGIDGRPFRYRKRDPKNVAEEIKFIQKRYGIGNVFVFDEIFTMPGHGEKVAQQLIAENIKLEFICEGKPDLVNESMLASLKAAGCMAVYYGIESGDADILIDIEKGHSTDDAKRAIRITKEAGILAGAYIMLGFANESVRTYLRTARFLFEARPDLVRYDFLLPYPATVIFREMNEAGLIEFDRAAMDRHVSRRYTPKPAFRSNFLGPQTLKMMERMMTVAFRDDLMRSPLPVSV